MSKSLTCRSKSPEVSEGSPLAGIPCAKPRGHKSRFHASPLLTKRWEAGVRTPARWEVVDDGYRSEADYEIERRYGL